jgi:hypothetical protein
MQPDLTVGRFNSRKAAQKGRELYIALHILARMSFYSKIDLKYLDVYVYKAVVNLKSKLLLFTHFFLSFFCLFVNLLVYHNI